MAKTWHHGKSKAKTSRPSSDLAFCRCNQCRAGLHHGDGREAELARRQFRRAIKALLKAGRFDEAEAMTRFTVCYTD